MFKVKQTLSVLSLAILSSQVTLAEVAKMPPITAGMTVLLDASDVDANGQIDTNYASSETITSWYNKSSLNGGASKPINNFFSIVGKEPKRLDAHLNGKAAIAFKKGGFVSSSIKQLTANSNYTKFVVFKIDDVASGNNLISSDSTALWLGQSVNADKQGALKSTHTGEAYLTDTKILDSKDYHIASTRYAKGLPVITPALSNTLRLDGKETVSNSLSKPFSDSATYIGMGDVEGTSEFLLQGEIAEVIIYNRALTNLEIKKVEKYLKDKWGGFKENKITTFTIAVGKKEKGKTLKLTGKSSSGLPVIFESATPSICKVTGAAFNQLKLLAIGKCIVDAGVNGNSIYRDADPIRETINVVAVATTPPPSNGGGSTTSSPSKGGGSTAPLGLMLIGLMALLRRRLFV